MRAVSIKPLIKSVDLLSRAKLQYVEQGDCGGRSRYPAARHH
jgi:hypothetical protein